MIGIAIIAILYGCAMTAGCIGASFKLYDQKRYPLALLVFAASALMVWTVYWGFSTIEGSVRADCIETGNRWVSGSCYSGKV